MARGIKTDEDLELLRTRIFPENDPRIPKDTLYVFPKRKDVKKYNERQLNLVQGDLAVLEATNILSTRRHFDPYIDETDGRVRNTPLTNALYLKKGASYTYTKHRCFGRFEQWSKRDCCRFCETWRYGDSCYC